MPSTNRFDHFERVRKAENRSRNYWRADRCEFSVSKLVGVHNILVATQSRKVFQTSEAMKTINIHRSCFIKKENFTIILFVESSIRLPKSDVFYTHIYVIRVYVIRTWLVNPAVHLSLFPQNKNTSGWLTMIWHSVIFNALRGCPRTNVFNRYCSFRLRSVFIYTL